MCASKMRDGCGVLPGKKSVGAKAPSGTVEAERGTKRYIQAVASKLEGEALCVV